MSAAEELRPDHAGVSVGDLEASVAWYRDMLGFDLLRIIAIPEAEETGRVALLRKGDFVLELFSLAVAAALTAAATYAMSRQQSRWDT